MTDLLVMKVRAVSHIDGWVCLKAVPGQPGAVFVSSACSFCTIISFNSSTKPIDSVPGLAQF